jgi:CDP-diacylglycerol---serine O-phosphatidyltransferase
MMMPSEPHTPGRRRLRLRKRRRGIRRRIPPVVFPSFFTLMNLLSGFLSVIYASQGNFVSAAWLIVLAGFFDALDGMMARLANATSQFGVELDSLSDVVSFGLASSFLIYQFGLYQLGLLGVILSALPVICGAIRLARFNVTASAEKKGYFTGLPIPVQAAYIVAFILTFGNSPFFHEIEGGQLSVLIPLVVVLSALMVSTVRFDALPSPSARTLREHPYRLLALVVAIFLALFFRAPGILIALTGYLLFGIGRGVVTLWQAAYEYEDGHDSPPPAST